MLRGYLAAVDAWATWISWEFGHWKFVDWQGCIGNRCSARSLMVIDRPWRQFISGYVVLFHVHINVAEYLFNLIHCQWFSNIRVLLLYLGVKGTDHHIKAPVIDIKHIQEHWNLLSFLVAPLRPVTRGKSYFWSRVLGWILWSMLNSIFFNFAWLVENMVPIRTWTTCSYSSKVRYGITVHIVQT